MYLFAYWCMVLRLLPALPGLILAWFLQGEELGVYVGLAKCLSAMSDSEIDRIAQVAEVKCCVIIS